MRSLALIALLGTCIASTHLVGQSLAEHAAAAAGATIGTAAGKPLGTSLGKIFGDVDKSTSTAVTPKAVRPVPSRTAPVAPAAAAPAPITGITDGGGEIPAGLLEKPSPHRRSARHRHAELAPIAAAPIAPVTPAIIAPAVKQITAEEVASVKLGETASQLRAALGPPESQVSIPDDDGHLLEICQYWSNGEEVGTVRLDNGRVVSVQPIN